MQYNLYINNRYRIIQYGITSLGISTCGEDSVPGIYTNVQHYMPWITNHLEL